ncbi:hypothetical protein C7T94_08180 [Pedobacter yulinensis]|uniref:Uncharacterized protein n=1 Tax=Pedobacter yulinensis TaxID=2126353 RepID=A0A2T3HJL6_9SPHI|nr:hypothetical protein [Pedobacter yulinensis]PST82632.1 hypothetical protein C7T94_08180 [Pedobacter yulinensis]
MEKACVDLNQLINVFTDASGAVYQSDKLNCLYLDFGGKFARFNCNALLKFKQAVERIDVEDMLLSSDRSDYELVTFNGCEHIYLLNAVEVISLRSLLQGAFTMFRLNHLINDCLYRLVS